MTTTNRAIEEIAESAIDLGMSVAREKLGDTLSAGIVKFPMDPILMVFHSALTDAIHAALNRPIEVVAEDGVDVTINIK